MATTRPKMLITGVSGLLGSNLAYYFKDRYDILGTYLRNSVLISGISCAKCDVTVSSDVNYIVSEFDPEIIIHCASLTDIDSCEKNKTATENVNIFGTKNIVSSILKDECKIIYISTDAVYDGLKGDFSESDKVRPQNYYGMSKYEGEKEVLRKQDSLVVRTNIFGWNIQSKKSLGEWFLDELISNNAIDGFSDAYFSTIYTMELAKVLDLAISIDLKGLYNCGSEDSCSKYDFGLKIAELFGLDKGLIRSIFINDSEFKASRGKDLSLNVSKIQKHLGYRLPSIDYCVETFYRDQKTGVREKLRQDYHEKPEEGKCIQYGRQWIDSEDIRAVLRVLRSKKITQGPTVEEFEEALVGYCGAKYGVAVNSGTSALHISCLAAGIEKGDEVITSPITFVASANCVVYCGGKPVFADIDRKTYNISPDEIEKKITQKTRAVIPVHFAGQSCDMEAVREAVKSAERTYGHRIFIIEDACHALGSKYKGRQVGACSYSDMTVMSFHPVKHITTGEGGVVLTNDEVLWKNLRRFRSHGITNTPEEFVYTDQAFQNQESGSGTVVNQWYYEQVDLGYNYRITDIQCALGCSQLRKIEKFRERRREIVNKYNNAFRDLKRIRNPFELEDCDSNFHLYVLLIDFDGMGVTRSKFINRLKKMNIQTQVHYIPVHTQPFYQDKFGTKWGDCPNAERYYQKCLSIPLYPSMTDVDVEQVIEAIVNLVEK
jgi:UDP-4-amino-4,6-dideoxy-N-acetyl-beta-L-altrosamine transaminase/dTDP-4-dehydrorhamnose reductase